MFKQNLARHLTFTKFKTALFTSGFEGRDVMYILFGKGIFFSMRTFVVEKIPLEFFRI